MLNFKQLYLLSLHFGAIYCDSNCIYGIADAFAILSRQHSFASTILNSAAKHENYSFFL